MADYAHRDHWRNQSGCCGPDAAESGVAVEGGEYSQKDTTVFGIGGQFCWMAPRYVRRWARSTDYDHVIFGLVGFWMLLTC